MFCYPTEWQLVAKLLYPTVCMGKSDLELCPQELQGVAAQDLEQRSSFSAVQFRREALQGEMTAWHLHTCEG